MSVQASSTNAIKIMTEEIKSFDQRTSDIQLKLSAAATKTESQKRERHQAIATEFAHRDTGA